MLEPFKKLAPEKQQQIIRAALKEFANQGYDRASTNQIVKEAGIGKGMLFYYFKSKWDLYLYLFDYSLDVIREEFLNKIDRNIDDFIDLLSHISKVKFQFFLKNPEISSFFTSFVLVDHKLDELPDELKMKFSEVYREGNSLMFNTKKNLSFLRDDIDKEKAYQLIVWTLRGYQQDFLEKFKGKRLIDLDMEEMWKEFDEYLEILRICFYRKREEKI